MKVLFFLGLIAVIALFAVATWEMHRESPFLPKEVEKWIVFLIWNSTRAASIIAREWKRRRKFRRLLNYLRLLKRVRGIEREQLALEKLESQLFEAFTRSSYAAARRDRELVGDLFNENRPRVSGDPFFVPYKKEDVEAVEAYLATRIFVLKSRLEVIDNEVREWIGKRRDEHVASLQRTRDALPKDNYDEYDMGRVLYEIGQKTTELTDQAERLIKSEHPSLENKLSDAFFCQLQHLDWYVNSCPYARTREHRAKSPRQNPL